MSATKDRLVDERTVDERTQSEYHEWLSSMADMEWERAGRPCEDGVRRGGEAYNGRVLDAGETVVTHARSDACWMRGGPVPKPMTIEERREQALHFNPFGEADAPDGICVGEQ